MIDAYDLPDHGMRDMLLRWHRTDPPGAYELWRNYVIEHIEGVRNPYIDGKALQDPG